MKTTCYLFVAAAVLMTSCQKTINDFDPSSKPATTTGSVSGNGSFAATIDGKAYAFSVTTATLLRSKVDNEKRLDVTGTSTDNTKRIIVTLGEETAQGNAVSVKKYVLNAFPDDDPATVNIDESLSTQGFTTYGTASGNNWIYFVFSENGTFNVTSCDASSTLLSGTFETTLTDLQDTSHIIRITAGKLTNVKYTVLN